MSKKTKIIVIRHGESLGNANRQMLGHTDLDLSEHGRLQAMTTAMHLKDEKIDKIYSSDLKRAFSTAIEHAKLRNMEVIPDKQLRELYLGDWEGLTVFEILDKYGDMYRVEWHGDFGHYTFPGGENVMSGGRRFHSEVQRIAEACPGETILIVAHAAVIRAFWSIIMEIDPSDIPEKLPFPSNGSYSVAYFEDGKFSHESYSNDAHLEAIGVTNVFK